MAGKVSIHVRRKKKYYFLFHLKWYRDRALSYNVYNVPISIKGLNTLKLTPKRWQDHIQSER